MHKAYITDVLIAQNEKMIWDSADIVGLKIGIESIYADGEYTVCVACKSVGKDVIGVLLDKDLRSSIGIDLALGWKAVIPVYQIHKIDKYWVAKVLIYETKDVDENDDKSLYDPDKPTSLDATEAFYGYFPDGYKVGTIKLG